VPGRAQLIGANSQARNARGMDGPWLPRSGAGWGDRRDCDVVEVLDFDTFDYTLPINLVFGDSLFTTCRGWGRGELTCFGERMLIVRCANEGGGVVAVVRVPNGHGNVQSGRYGCAAQSGQAKHG